MLYARSSTLPTRSKIKRQHGTALSLALVTQTNLEARHASVDPVIQCGNCLAPRIAGYLIGAGKLTDNAPVVIVVTCALGTGESQVRFLSGAPIASVAQWTRAPGFEPGCREFESLRGLQMRS